MHGGRSAKSITEFEASRGIWPHPTIGPVSGGASVSPMGASPSAAASRSLLVPVRLPPTYVYDQIVRVTLIVPEHWPSRNTWPNQQMYPNLIGPRAQVCRKAQA